MSYVPEKNQSVSQSIYLSDMPVVDRNNAIVVQKCYFSLESIELLFSAIHIQTRC